MCDMEKLQKQEPGQLVQMRAVIASRYLNLVLNHPRKTIVATLTISFILVIISASLHYDIFDFDPTKGFETRGTELASARLTLEAIKRTAATSAEILQSRNRRSINKRQAKVFKLSHISSTNPATSMSTDTKSSYSTTTLEPISIDYNDYGLDSEPTAVDLLDPCFQYYAVGTYVPYQNLDFLAKVVLEIDEHKLYSIGVFRKLCAIDEVIDAVVKHSIYKPAYSPAKHSFNLPHYSNCLNFTTPNKCAALNIHDIRTLQTSVSKCRDDPSLSMCTSHLMGQVLNYLLPKSAENNKYVTVLLKIPASDNRPGSLQFYNELLESLQKHFLPDITVKGAFFNVKNDEFISALFRDTKLASISAVLVLLCFLLYARSVFYMAIVAIIIFLSMGVAFFFYTVILRINFFPALNSLVLVLMIAVGADDAFLLMVYYRKYKKLKAEPYQVGDPYIPLYKEHDRVVRAIRNSIHHSLASMFVTSATTAVAFISNLTSEIIVLRCFGVYACLTVMVNYILVVFLLPSTMTLCCKEGQRKFLPEYDVASRIAHTVFSCRYPITMAGAAATIIAALVVFVNPGLSLPRYNPTKLLTNKHPYEWFDNNGHLFNFEWRRSWKFTENYIIGIRPVSSTSFFNPYKLYELSHEEFTPTKRELNQIQENINLLIVSRGYGNYTSWLSKFFAANIRCNLQPSIDASCYLEFARRTLPAEVCMDFAQGPSDGPIFDKKFRLFGYFISLPSNRTLTLDSVDVENVAKEIDANCKRMVSVGSYPILCLTSSDMAKYYDIIATLPLSTLFSVIISVVVSLGVVILTTRRLLLSIIAVIVICGVILWTIAVSILLGWELSVVESTIIVLTIGLGFDFTLHIAVAYRDDKEVCMEARTGSCLSSAGRACVLGAVTSVLCGIPLIFAYTAAFTQVGSLLIILGATSLCGAAVLYPATLASWATLRSTKVHVVRF